MATEAQKSLIASLQANGVSDKAVLDAMLAIPRHHFVPKYLQQYAYDDHALAIHCGQTISQPFLVAFMTQVLRNGEHLNKVLEIGTGSGYQTAILSELVDEVYSIERIKTLYQTAKEKLAALNLNNVQLLFGDGCLGWPKHAPYDGIIVTAAAETVPDVLMAQLADGARMVVPVNHNGGQDLNVITRHGDRYETRTIDKVIFVPLMSGIKED